MNVIFTELYDRERKELGITKKESLNVILHPDNIQEEIIDDLILRFYLKTESHGNSILLIQTRVLADKLFLDLPLRILSDLFPNLEVLEPLMILQLMAQEFGLYMKIGSKVGKFIYKEEIPIIKEGGEIIQIRNPENHSFLQSIFIKKILNQDNVVVKCALAFCIDKTHYINWLSSEHKITPPIKRLDVMNVTRIIPLDVVKGIIEYSIKYEDEKKRFNIVELALSLQIIRKIMGNQWYRNVLKQFVPGEKITNREYRRLVRSNSIHPLSEALWSGDPKQYFRIIALAQFLNQLWRFDNSNNFQEKIKELQRYSFIHTYYELKIASYFNRRGFSVTFIKRRKDEKTPEFRIDSSDGYAFCECKRKDSPTIEIDNLLEDAASQIESYGGPGIIFVEIPTQLDKRSVNDVRERAIELLTYNRKVALFILTHEYFSEEFEIITGGTKVYGVFNDKAHFSLPEKIKKVALFQEPIAWYPLSQTISS